jgi:hypothetical protein
MLTRKFMILRKEQTETRKEGRNKASKEGRREEVV